MTRTGITATGRSIWRMIVYVTISRNSRRMSHRKIFSRSSSLEGGRGPPLWGRNRLMSHVAIISVLTWSKSHRCPIPCRTNADMSKIPTGRQSTATIPSTPPNKTHWPISPTNSSMTPNLICCSPETPSFSNQKNYKKSSTPVNLNKIRTNRRGV